MATLGTVRSEDTSGRRRARRGWAAFLASLAFLTVVTSSGPLVAASPPEHALGEGFSTSRRGLPQPARQAWNATVLVVKLEERAGTVDDPFRPRSGWGSGLVLALDDAGGRRGRRSAVIATTSHVVSCTRPPCRYAIGFADPRSGQARHWTMRASLEDSSPGSDLAFLRAEVPPQASPSAARLADPACHGEDLAPALAVGWPNLSLRTAWNVQPPSNAHLLLKRYSIGSRVQYISSYPLGGVTVEQRERVPIVFHNADLMPGCSGGPLLDENGHVVGLNSRIFVPGDRPQRYDYCAARADQHSPGEDCINVALSAQAIAAAFQELFGSRLVVEACRGAGDERRRAGEVSDLDDTAFPPELAIGATGR